MTGPARSVAPDPRTRAEAQAWASAARAARAAAEENARVAVASARFAQQNARAPGRCANPISFPNRHSTEARFVSWEGESVLQVPTSALFRQGQGWAVFVLDGRRVRAAPVEVGQRAGLATEALSGI